MPHNDENWLNGKIEHIKRTEQDILNDFEKLGYHICVESWATIKEFPNYQISNLGNVKNSQGKILKPELTKKGYLQIKLFNGSTRKGIRVHRLVAQYFIPNPCNLPHVNHRNGIKTDNKVCNLEWVTPSENNEHAIKTGLRPALSEEQRKINSERLKKIRPTLNTRFREITGINLLTGETKTYHRIVDTKQDGFEPTNVYATCRGKTRWHKGWFWHYKEDVVEEKIINKIKLAYKQYIDLKEKGNVCFANIQKKVD